MQSKLIKVHVNKKINSKKKQSGDPEHGSYGTEECRKVLKCLAFIISSAVFFESFRVSIDGYFAPVDS